MTEDSSNPYLPYLPATDPDHRPGWHPVSIGPLVMGIAFLALVGVWALVQGDVVAGGDIRWLLPVPWVLGGGGGLVALALANRRRTTGDR